MNIYRKRYGEFVSRGGRISREAAVAAFGEGKKASEDGVGGVWMFFEFLAGLGAVQSLTVEGFVNKFDEREFFFRKALAAQTDFVENLYLGGVPIGDHIGRNVLHDFGARTRHGVITDATKLVNPCVPANVDVISDYTVSAQSGARAHHQMVAHYAIVRDVAVGKHHIVVAYGGDFSLMGATMNGDVFAKGVVVADGQTRPAARVLQILRLPADERVRENFISLAQGGISVNGRMMMDVRAATDYYVFANVRIRADGDLGGELRSFFNDGGRVDF